MEQNRKTQWEAQLPYACWLHQVAGLGNRTRRELIRYAGTAKAVYELPLQELKGLLKGKKLQYMEQAKKNDVMEDYGKLLRAGIRFLPEFHPEYPQKLLRTEDAPYALYVLGGLPRETVPTVAVIGARECSEYGRYMAAVCGRELAESGVQVISGMARGIDGIAQSAALKAGGGVYAVLGCGVDVCYPAQNRVIYEQMKANGGVCSEYPPQTAARAQLFPPRNRIISGMADLVLIIEAREKSGTLITADMALEQGREVYAVPGRITDPLSAGCNRLLRQGAGIFSSVKELLEESGWLTDLARQKENAARQESGTREREKEKEHGAADGRCTENANENDREKERVAACLDFYPLSVSCLQQKTGLSYRPLLGQLFRLCLEGRARQVSADSYVLLPGGTKTGKVL